MVEKENDKEEIEIVEEDKKLEMTEDDEQTGEVEESSEPKKMIDGKLEQEDEEPVRENEVMEAIEVVEATDEENIDDEGAKEEIVEGEADEKNMNEKDIEEKKIEGDVKKESPKEDDHEKERSHSNKTAITLSVLGLTLGIAGAVMGGLGYYNSTRPVTYLSSGVDGNSANFTEGSIASVADAVSKGVVSIVTEMKSTDVFGQTYASGAAGTGMIATADGYIITNKHVVSGASTVTIVLDDGTTYKNVKVVATDPLNDVAYLKIDDATNLPVVKLGNSNTVSVGEQVIAIGNALGEYQNTVTSGIISGTGRTLTATDESGSMSENLSGMLQTDAAINGGNSGGPLVNAAAEVIGINTAYSSSAENMGFAIPISSVKGMLAQLVETGKAERAYIGVYNTQITPEIAKEYNLPVSSGVYLYSQSAYTAIVPNSPAAKAGLKDKDIITKINGIEVGPVGTLSNIIGEYKPGDTVDLTVIRDGQEMSVKVTLEGYKEK
ncbi:trypsin-like peptidase domain-containing protein [Candidatus Saccharibacteria bacterium]|nr:trypsin-like peptidase domain-containing protein [Candidatus Saccharibacteria bacterium]